MRATRFPTRADGPAERVAGFVAHLRLNGWRLGPGDTADAVAALAHVAATDREQARAALKVLLVPDHERWRAFDGLFDAYWMNAGRTRERTAEADRRRKTVRRPPLWQPHLAPPPDQETDPGADSDPTAPSVPDGGDGA
ncbi:MAG: carbon monoxide dehydrogenase, partial [Pseudomonadota bacterium]